MVSRETIVHFCAVAVGLAVLVVADLSGIGPDSGPFSIAVLLLFYGLVLGGAHLYFALRGEDGLVPTEARWRYLGLLAVVFGTVATIEYAGDRSVGPTTLETVGLVLVVLAVVAYAVTESVAGYRESRPE